MAGTDACTVRLTGIVYKHVMYSMQARLDRSIVIHKYVTSLILHFVQYYSVSHLQFTILQSLCSVEPEQWVVHVNVIDITARHGRDRERTSHDAYGHI